MVQRALVIQRLGGCGGDCRGGKLLKRPFDGVFVLHRHGPRSHRGQCDAAGLQDGSTGLDGAAVTGARLVLALEDTAVDILREIQTRMTIRRTRLGEFEGSHLLHVCVQRYRLD